MQRNTQPSARPHVFHFDVPVNAATTNALQNVMLEAIQLGQPSSLTLLINSTGGNLTAGFGLFNFLRSLPMPVTTHNFGTVESIAVIVYLAGEERKIVPTGRFLLHGLNWGFDSGSIDHARISEFAASLDSHSATYQQIFNERTQSADAPVDILECLSGKARIVDASSSVKAGIATAIAPPEAAVPADSVHWWISFQK